MALKPTIYKLKISLSDFDRNVYDTLSLTIAQHPSESLERMMVRVLAYCINVQEGLTFTKGLSVPDEPDIWSRTFDDRIQLWIDVGEPAVDRIKKATHTSDQVKVYSFNSKSSVWWKQEGHKFAVLPAQVYRVNWPQIQALAALVQRTMDFSVSITEGSAYISADRGDCEVRWECLESH